MTTTAEQALEQVRALHAGRHVCGTHVWDYADGLCPTARILASVDAPMADEAPNIDLRARELAETVVKAATSLKEWRDGDFARQAQRIDAVQALLEPRMRAADVSPAPPAAQGDR